MIGDRVTRLAPVVASVLAPNPGPMTLSGTNTWVLGRPGRGCLVVDPGPDDEAHLRRVLDVVDGPVRAVLVTHRHLDHVAGAARLAALAGCGVRAADPAWRIGDADDASDTADGGGLDDGSVVEVDDVRVEVLATPGHTSDSVSLLVEHEDGTDLLTGDTVLGFGSTVIAQPDGDLGAYLTSLDRLLAVVADRGVDRILPGHGPVVGEPAAVLEGYRSHRRERLDQVRAALDAGARTPVEVLSVVYPDAVGSPLERAALQSVQAQLDHLQAHRAR